MEINKNMAKRLILIRQKEGKTQAEFADILKIGRSTLTNLENGTTIFTDKNVNMACLAFNVNETWLKTGIGEMFNPPPKNPENPKEQQLIEMFRKLVPEMQDIVLKKVYEMVKSIEQSWVPPVADNEKGEQKGA